MGNFRKWLESQGGNLMGGQGYRSSSGQSYRHSGGGTGGGDKGPNVPNVPEQVPQNFLEEVNRRLAAAGHPMSQWTAYAIENGIRDYGIVKNINSDREVVKFQKNFVCQKGSVGGRVTIARIKKGRNDYHVTMDLSIDNRTRTISFNVDKETAKQIARSTKTQ